MKTKASVAVLLWLFFANVLAMNYKLFTGINTSKYLFSETITQIDHKPKTSLGLGLGISFQILDGISLEINSIYNTIGAKTQILYTPELKLTGIYRNTNLVFPILVKYRFFSFSTPYFGIGPELICILSHDLEIPEMKKKISVLDSTKKLNAGLTLVAGYEYKIGNLTFFGELSYNRWLTNFFKNTTAFVKSEAWAFYIGLNLNSNVD